jgi:hypothetical protein
VSSPRVAAHIATAASRPNAAATLPPTIAQVEVRAPWSSQVPIPIVPPTIAAVEAGCSTANWQPSRLVARVRAPRR